jgi:[ribosomal protein S5]-alanine N-acetyltransferase
MKIITETERLIIREILPTDIDEMFELHSDPEVHSFLGNKTVTSKEQIVDIINFVRQQYIEHGVGRWAMIDKNTKEFLGWTGLEFVTKETNNHKNYYDLGYRLIKRFWGQGFATESAFASLNYAFDQLNATEVYAMADCRNEGSNKILKKVGLTFIETFNLEGIKHNWYNVDKTVYVNRTTLRHSPGHLKKL